MKGPDPPPKPSRPLPEKIYDARRRLSAPTAARASACATAAEMVASASNTPPYTSRVFFE